MRTRYLAVVVASIVTFASALSQDFLAYTVARLLAFLR